jgi:Cu+-exporting ATPase
VANATVTLAVTGMTCEGCVGHVQEALAGTPGVASATVSLAQRQAVVGYDAARVQPEALIAAIVKAGYQASVAPLSAASAASHTVPLPAGAPATPAAQ